VLAASTGATASVVAPALGSVVDRVATMVGLLSVSLAVAAILAQPRLPL